MLVIEHILRPDSRQSFTDDSSRRTALIIGSKGKTDDPIAANADLALFEYSGRTFYP